MAHEQQLGMLFFYWLITVMPLETHWLWGHVLFGTFTVIKVLGLLCLFIAVCRIVTKHLSLDRFYGGSSKWTLVFTTILAVAALHSLPQAAPGAWSHIVSIISLLITVPTLVTTRKRLNRTLLVAIGAAGVASLYLIRQQRYYVGGFRAGGMSGDPNYFASLVGLWIPLAVLWSFSKRPRWERIFCAGCLLLIFVAWTLAASRGGSLGLLAAFVYLIARSKKPIRNLLVVGALIASILLFMLSLPSSHLDRFTHPAAGDEFSEQARLISWKSGLRMVSVHPLAGVGLQNFQAVVLQYQDPRWLTPLNNYQPITYIAHNTYIELAAESGMPGALSWIALLAATFISLEQDRRRSVRAKSAHLANIALGLQGGLLCFAVSVIFLSDWWERMFWLLIFLSVSLHRIRIPSNLSAIKRPAATGRPSGALQPQCISLACGSDRILERGLWIRLG